MCIQEQCENKRERDERRRHVERILQSVLLKNMETKEFMSDFALKLNIRQKLANFRLVGL